MIPPGFVSTVQPKIAPSASETVFTKDVTALIALFNALTSGFNALMNVPPITVPSALKFSFKILIWLAHVSAVLAKSPCDAVVLASTYW